MISETHVLPIGLKTFQEENTSLKGGYETTLKEFNPSLEQEIQQFMKFNHNPILSLNKKTKTNKNYSNKKKNKTQKNF
tara:strand:+ start:997 stop:1230 length:234 start_codon:yes stop_codon:yes gene_type:complete